MDDIIPKGGGFAVFNEILKSSSGSTTSHISATMSGEMENIPSK
jgi:hypothetical protein